MSLQIQIQKAEMRLIMNAMADKQAEITKLLTDTKSMVEDTHNNTWIGKAADKFYDEMTSMLLVRLGKVAEGLGKAQEVAKKAIATLDQADQETKGYFKGLI